MPSTPTGIRPRKPAHATGIRSPPLVELPESFGQGRAGDPEGGCGSCLVAARPFQRAEDGAALDLGERTAGGVCIAGIGEAEVDGSDRRSIRENGGAPERVL